MSTSHRAVTPCGWGVKAVICFGCGLQLKLCDPQIVTRGPYLSALEIGTIKCYINSTYLHYFTAAPGVYVGWGMNLIIVM